MDQTPQTEPRNDVFMKIETKNKNYDFSFFWKIEDFFGWWGWGVSGGRSDFFLKNRKYHNRLACCPNMNS